jgi:hypothetical protein
VSGFGEVTEQEQEEKLSHPGHLTSGGHIGACHFNGR